MTGHQKALTGLLVCVSAAPAANLAFEADRWERAKDAVVIADMSRVEPASALSTVRNRRHWKVLDYETASIKGKCIASMPDTGAPAVNLRLNAAGWHAVYVGLGGMGRFAFGQENVVRLKLTREAAYRQRVYTGAKDDIDEVFFQAADLTGQSLQIAQARFEAMMDLRPPHLPRSSVVMYVKLVPLTAAEIDWVRRDRADPATKRLVATMDAFSWLHQNFPTTRAEFQEYLEEFRDSDFGTIYWQIIGGGLVNYRSKLGTIPGALAGDYPRTGDGYATESIRKFIEMGTDQTRLAVEAARSMGKKILIGFRLSSWQCPPQFEDYFTSDFYRDHPEWRTYDRDGTPVMRMSYAVPEVRQHVLGILRETLAYRPDGIELIFFRGLPLMLWEDAFSNRFREKYGEDAKQVAENYPRLYALRCEIVTRFMRDIRKLLDETQRAQGRKERLELSASVVHTEEDNRMHGLDVERWAKEGLIDRVGIFPAAFHTSKKPVDLDWFFRITKGTKVDVYPLMIGWKLPTSKETLAEARRYYGAGAKGLIIWDPDPVSAYTAQKGSYYLPRRAYWPLVSRLGHVDDLEQLEAGAAPKYIPLKRYGDYWFGRWIPDVGF